MSTDPILAPDAIAALNAVAPDDNGAFLRELIDIFLADTPARVADVKRTLASQDGPALTRAAHSIKGASGNFGAYQLASISQRIETCAKAADFAGAQQLLPELETEFFRVRTAMEALRAR